MPSHNVTIVREKGVLVARLSREEKKNAIDAAMYGALAEALASAEAEEGVRAVLIAGSGGNFTSGNDLADFLDPAAFGAESPALRFIGALVGARKPVVAAVEGLAIGIGVTMLLHCDLVVAGKGARFQLPFVNLGLCPEAGSSLLLPALAGRRGASELLLLGEAFTAERARELGVVNSVVADGGAEEAALALARRLAAQPAAALRLAKELIGRGQSAALRETIEAEARLFRDRLSSPEAAEAFAAFRERRQPDFSRFA